MRHCSVFTGTFAAILLLPNAAPAQEPRPVFTAPSASTLGARVGATVRVTTLRSSRLEGQLAAIDDTSLTLVAGGSQLRLIHAEIDTLWVRRGSAVRGALIGGLISAAALSIAACRSGCAESGVVFPGLLITPLPGILVGAFIGTRVGRWDRRHPL